MSAKWKNFELTSMSPPHVQPSQDAPFEHLGCNTDVLCSSQKFLRQMQNNLKYKIVAKKIKVSVLNNGSH